MQSIKSLKLANASAFLCSFEEGDLLVRLASSFILAPVVRRDPGGLPFAFLCALEEGDVLVRVASSFILAPVVSRDPGGLLSSSPIESVGEAVAPHTAAFGWFNSTTFEMTNCQTTKR